MVLLWWISPTTYSVRSLGPELGQHQVLSQNNIGFKMETWCVLMSDDSMLYASNHTVAVFFPQDIGEKIGLLGWLSHPIDEMISNKTNLSLSKATSLGGLQRDLSWFKCWHRPSHRPFPHSLLWHLSHCHHTPQRRPVEKGKDLWSSFGSVNIPAFLRVNLFMISICISDMAFAIYLIALIHPGT